MSDFSSPSVFVSVIMPMYNAERYVVSAVHSVLREKNIPIELIVVDDGSTDGSFGNLQRIEDNRLRLLRNPGKGIASALNAGLAAAKGQIITRCDADDCYPADRLKTQVEWLMQNPDFAAVCGGYSVIDPNGSLVINFRCGTDAEEITNELQNGITRTHLCTFAIRAEALRSLGGFRPYFTTAEDIDLQLRLGDRFKVAYLPCNNYHYRLHDTSITHTKSSAEREFFDVIAREFQKQRHQTGQDDLQRHCPPPLPQPTDKAPLTAALHIQGFLLSRAWQEFQRGQTRQAVITGLRAAFTQPNNWSVWKSLLVLGLKSIDPRRLFFLNGRVVLSRE